MEHAAHNHTTVATNDVPIIEADIGDPRFRPEAAPYHLSDESLARKQKLWGNYECERNAYEAEFERRLPNGWTTTRQALKSGKPPPELSLEVRSLLTGAAPKKAPRVRTDKGMIAAAKLAVTIMQAYFSANRELDCFYKPAPEWTQRMKDMYASYVAHVNAVAWFAPQSFAAFHAKVDLFDVLLADNCQGCCEFENLRMSLINDAVRMIPKGGQRAA